MRSKNRLRNENHDTTVITVIQSYWEPKKIEIFIMCADGNMTVKLGEELLISEDKRRQRDSQKNKLEKRVARTGNKDKEKF